jgi:hypothetical protein
MRMSPGSTLMIVVDQGVSSASNVILGVSVARVGSVEEFGQFSLFVAIYLICVGFLRAAGPELIAVSHGRAKNNPDLVVLSGGVIVIGSLACVGAVSAMVAAAFSTAWLLMVAGAASLPVLLLQDYLRMRATALGNALRSCKSDGTWILVQLALFGVLALLDVEAPVAFLGAWSVGALLALWPFRRDLARMRYSRAGLAYVKGELGLISRYCGEFATGYGSMQLLTFVLAVFVSVAGVAGLRGAYTLLGPANAFMNGALSAAIPDLARRVRPIGDRFGRRVRVYSFGVGCVVLTGGIALLLLPSSLGFELLGATWESSRQLLPAVLVAICANGFAVGLRAGVRVLSIDGEGIMIRLALGPTSAGLGMVGALLAGISGAAWGIATGNVLGLVVLWIQFRMYYAAKLKLGAR